VRVTDIHVFDAVGFLIGTGELMLFDGAVHVFIHRCQAHQSHLGTAIHHLAVNVKHGFIVLLHHAALDVGIKVFSGLGIDLGIIKIGAQGQIHLWLFHVDIAERVFGHFGTGFI